MELLVLSITSLIVLSLSLLALHRYSIKSLQDQLQFLKIQNADLLNRVQAADFQTYKSLAAVAGGDVEFPDYVSSSDYRELKTMAEAQGLGSEIFDDGNADDDDFDDTVRELLT